MFRQSSPHRPDDGPEYIKGDHEHEVLSAERKALGLREGAPTCGLALSGGGVRSAAFSLGVVQALLAKLAPLDGKSPLERFHFLSTVSGGGYLGLALVWLRGLFPPSSTPTADYRKHFGSKQRGARSEGSHVWLDYFRQHGNYLLPRGLSSLDLVGVVLRNLILSVGVYVGLAVVALAFALHLGIVGEPTAGTCAQIARDLRFCLAADAASLLLSVTSWLIAATVLFGLGTFVASLGSFARRFWSVVFTAAVIGLVVLTQHAQDASNPRMGMALWTSAIFAALLCLVMLGKMWGNTTTWIYEGRIRMQQLFGTLLGVAIALLLLASLHPVHKLVSGLIGTAKMSGILSALGVIGAYYQAMTGRTKTQDSSAFSTLRLVATAFALSYGLLLGAYVIADRIALLPGQAFLLLAALLVPAFFVNLNLMSTGRMYRDRLMETFLPDGDTIRKNVWNTADRAEGAQGSLRTMWELGGRSALLPLVNTNVVLVDSDSDKFRNRGGDSFTVSPLYCGSNATGWIHNASFADGHVTVATAMATSGAAANPNSAPGGRGVTRNRLVSFVMFLVQARLGVWSRNPARSCRGSHPIDRVVVDQRPSLLHPGIISGLLGRRLREDTIFVELTDGGHFDNTGIYELIRRRTDLIVAAQASCDPYFGMADLANVAEKVRVDFGVHLRFDEGVRLDGLVPTIEGTGPGNGRLYAKRGHALARIDYPEILDSTGKQLSPAKHGWLVYLQATPITGVPVDVHACYQSCPKFPNETTADQFFDEVQLESYRELGYAIGKQAVLELAGCPTLPAFSQLMRSLLPTHEQAPATSSVRGEARA